MSRIATRRCCTSKKSLEMRRSKNLGTCRPCVSCTLGFADPTRPPFVQTQAQIIFFLPPFLPILFPKFRFTNMAAANGIINDTGHSLPTVYIVSAARTPVGMFLGYVYSTATELKTVLTRSLQFAFEY